MERTYQLQPPIATRPAQSMTLAPTASMIDPNLQAHRLNNPQLSHTFAFSQGQSNNTAAMMGDQADTSITQDSADRALPSIEVTDESIDQAYVDFIFYCNPAIPLDTDTTELRKGFRSPPMSDGKKFSPFIIFGLISRLELKKEIKTWVQLVVELGVELPDPSKHQSTQKVQQYAVRLKVFAPSMCLFLTLMERPSGADHYCSAGFTRSILMPFSIIASAFPILTTARFLPKTI